MSGKLIRPFSFYKIFKLYRQRMKWNSSISKGLFNLFEKFWSFWHSYKFPFYIRLNLFQSVLLGNNRKEWWKLFFNISQKQIWILNFFNIAELKRKSRKKGTNRMFVRISDGRWIWWLRYVSYPWRILNWVVFHSFILSNFDVVECWYERKGTWFDDICRFTCHRSYKHNKLRLREMIE
jgi:hypothetical protein